MLEKKNKYIFRVLFFLIFCLFFFPSTKVFAAWGNQQGDGGANQGTFSGGLISWQSDEWADSRYGEFNYHLDDFKINQKDVSNIIMFLFTY